MDKDNLELIDGFEDFIIYYDRENKELVVYNGNVYVATNAYTFYKDSMNYIKKEDD